MIFISYNHKDSELVDIVSQQLLTVFGRDRVFYDKWSIQPGDGIIEKMNEGLNNCKFFFFFVSKNSLLSNMVKLEWQNALIKATKNQAKFIPVKLDDCLMPPILLQTLYIDIFGQGLEVGIRQIIDVINGKNTYSSKPQTYENIRAYLDSSDNDLKIEIRAETYMEPQSKYILLIENNEQDFNFSCTTDSMLINVGFQTGLQLNNGVKTNGYLFGLQRPTSPGFPVIVKLVPKNDQKISVLGIMRAISHEQYRQIPMIKK